MSMNASAVCFSLLSSYFCSKAFFLASSSSLADAIYSTIYDLACLAAAPLFALSRLTSGLFLSTIESVYVADLARDIGG